MTLCSIWLPYVYPAVNDRGQAPWLVVFGWLFLTVGLHVSLLRWDQVTKDDDVRFFPTRLSERHRPNSLPSGLSLHASSSQLVLIYERRAEIDLEPASAARAKKQLDELTQQTGGRSWFPNDVAQIANITPEIAHEIRNQYILAYTPTNLAADGSFRKIRVDVDVPGAVVRTRAGYYAPK